MARPKNAEKVYLIDLTKDALVTELIFDGLNPVHQRLYAKKLIYSSEQPALKRARALLKIISVL